MTAGQASAVGGTNGAIETLSTGHQVRLPLSTHATMTFLCVDYDRIGHNSNITQYNEFGVLIPAVHDDSRTLPYVSVLTRGVTGYIWHLPVTSEPAKALGVDIWGYQKEVAEITHDDDGSTRHTSVHLDGQHLIDVTVDRPPTVSQTDSGVSYTTKDGHVLREELELDGEIGVWPYSNSISYTLGDHPRAERLRDLDPSERALLRFAADTEFGINEGEWVGSV